MIDHTTRGELLAARRQAMAAAMRAGLRDRSLCDEVAQEVMGRAWRHGVLSMSPSARGGWVHTTARRYAIDLLRRARRTARDEGALDALASEGGAAMSEERLDARREVDAVSARACALPPSLRAVFDAVVCEGRAIDEVSRALAVSRAVVDTRLRRMRTRLAA